MKFFKYYDILLIAVLLFVAFFAQKMLSGGNGAVAEITVDGEIWKTVDLKNVESPYFLEINGDKIEVDTGKIRFYEADCPDRRCISFGWLSSPGDFASCVPNKIAIRISGENSPDAVTG